MPKRYLTEKTVRGLKTDEPKGVQYTDSKINGKGGTFGMSVHPSGARVWWIRYTTKDGRRRWYKLGHYPKLTADRARELARLELGRVAAGGDPAADIDARKDVPTFKSWADEYLELLEKKKTRSGEDPRRLTQRMAKDREFIGLMKKRWSGRRLDEITRTDVRRFFDSQTKRSDTMGNRALACVRACLNGAIKADLITSNPAVGIDPNPEPLPRRRVLSDAEMQRLLKAIDDLEDKHARVGLLMLVMTGTRVSEVLQARWADLDLEQGQWTLPTTKANRRQDVPLPKPLIKELKALDRDGLYVVPGGIAGRPRESLRGPWDKVRKAAKLTDAKLHDLRRSFGRAVTIKYGLHMAQQLLRHSDIRVTERSYAPLAFKELKAASNGVVPFKKRKQSNG